MVVFVRGRHPFHNGTRKRRVFSCCDRPFFMHHDARKKRPQKRSSEIGCHVYAVMEALTFSIQLSSYLYLSSRWASEQWMDSKDHMLPDTIWVCESDRTSRLAIYSRIMKLATPFTRCRRRGVHGKRSNDAEYESGKFPDYASMQSSTYAPQTRGYHSQLVR